MQDIDADGSGAILSSDPADVARDREIDPKLLEILVCPMTKTPLRYDRAALELISDQAGLAFPIRNGVPIMLIDEARVLDDDPVADGVAALARRKEEEAP